VKDKEE